MKTILLIHTGGTISMREDARTGSVHPSGRNPLLDFTPALGREADLIVEEPFHKPSPHITAADMLELKMLIERHCRDGRIDGAVITHGTDTLEETAYFLDLTVQADIPIIVTGAMRSSNEIGSDGPYNLLSALRVATADDAKGKGVLVVLNDEIHTAVNVTKTHSSNVSTFQSPQYGPIGIVTKRAIIFHHEPTDFEKYEIGTRMKRTTLLKAYAGMDSSLFDAVLGAGFDGVVVEALGQGNLPPAAVPGVRRLLDAGIPVVIVSRCFNGIAQDVYGYEGGGQTLKEIGAIFCNGLNGPKARMKLMIAMSKTSDFKELNELFSK